MLPPHHQQLMRGNSLPPSGQSPYPLGGLTPTMHMQQPPLLQSQSTSQNDNFKVVIRVRPPLPREMKDDMEFRGIV